jgi:hypothetical protein
LPPFSSASETGGADASLEAVWTSRRRIPLKESYGIITEFWHVRQALIGHLYDALGQDRARRE